MANSKKFFSVIDIFVYILIFLGVNIIFSILGSFYLSDKAILTDTKLMGQILYVPIFFFSIIFILIYRAFRVKNADLKYNLPRLGWSRSPAILLSIIIMFAISIVTEPLMHLFPDAVTSYLDNVTSGDKLVNFVIIVIAAPIFEEYLFRGLIMRDIASRWGSRVAIFLSAAIFALLHFNMVQFPTAFLMGIYLGYAYYRTRQYLATVILIHAVNNMIALNLAYFGLSTNTTRELFQLNNTQYWILYSAACLVLIWLIFRVFKTNAMLGRSELIDINKSKKKKEIKEIKEIKEE